MQRPTNTRKSPDQSIIVEKILLPLFGLACLAHFTASAQEAKPPVRFAIVGLAHDHAVGFIPRLHGRQDVQLVGIVETNPTLIARFSERFNLEPNLFYPSLEALLTRTHVQAVAAFTSVFDNSQVVEACAAHRSAQTGKQIKL